MVIPIYRAIKTLAPEATHYMTKNVLSPIGEVAAKTLDSVAPPRSHRRFIATRILVPASLACVNIALLTKAGSYIPAYLDEDSRFAVPVDFAKGITASFFACGLTDLYWKHFADWKKSQPDPLAKKKD